MDGMWSECSLKATLGLEIHTRTEEQESKEVVRPRRALSHNEWGIDRESEKEGVKR